MMSFALSSSKFVFFRCFAVSNRIKLISHSFVTVKVKMSAPWPFPNNIAEIYNLAPVGSNSPNAAPKSVKELTEGSTSLQLYSVGTPNGQKIGILLEELGIPYDAHAISFSGGDHFTTGFKEINPNGKIPALLDKEGLEGKPIRLFESASIMIYLADKYGMFIPKSPSDRVECINWTIWSVGGFGPNCGVFNHFFLHATPEKEEARGYGMARYGMEVQRHFSVLDRQLEGKSFVMGDEYTIADMISFTWCNVMMNLVKHPSGLSARSFLNLDQYNNVLSWVERIGAREAVKRGLTVCTNGVGKPWLK